MPRAPAEGYLRCPNCNCFTRAPVSSAPASTRSGRRRRWNAIYRIRECENCHGRYRTVERIDPTQAKPGRAKGDRAEQAASQPRATRPPTPESPTPESDRDASRVLADVELDDALSGADPEGVPATPAPEVRPERAEHADLLAYLRETCPENLD